MAGRLYEVTDDSGFLAVIDPDAYVAFVDEDWSLEQLLQHFKEQSEHGRMLIWGTGSEGTWPVEVRSGLSEDAGVRELEGALHVSRGRLLLTNYESLTMAAQVEEAALPEPHDRDLLFEIPSGEYRCRVVQLVDPEDWESEASPAFVVELAPGEARPPDPWLQWREDLVLP